MNRSTEELQHAMIEQLMAIIGAPDDPQVAEAADAAVHAVEERMREEAAT
ncbi:hypothetical protein [Streptomyces sp. NPDC050560]